MKTYIATLIVVAHIFVCQSAAQNGRGVKNLSVDKLPAKEKRWALIVGIDEHQNDVSPL